jgi:hypothetical protein
MAKTSRRVYVPELRGRLGYGRTWFAYLIRNGKVPQPHYDPGSRRGWYTDAEADEILEKLNERATRGPAAAPAMRKASTRATP